MFPKIILVMLFMYLSLFATPIWFNKRDFMNEENVFYGYGEGYNKKTARANALREISEQISAKINSFFLLQTNTLNQSISENTNSYNGVSGHPTRFISDTKKEDIFCNSILA